VERYGPGDEIFKKPAWEHLVIRVLTLYVDAAISKQELLFDRRNIRAEALVDDMNQRLVAALIYNLAAGEHKYEDRTHGFAWPDGWWEAFKERWFWRWPPRLVRWLRLGRWYKRHLGDVKYQKHTVSEKTTITRVCPHIPVPNDRHNACLSFLVPEKFHPGRPPVIDCPGYSLGMKLFTLHGPADGERPFVLRLQPLHPDIPLIRMSRPQAQEFERQVRQEILTYDTEGPQAWTGKPRSGP
jgi:hypothetical protein